MKMSKVGKFLKRIHRVLTGLRKGLFGLVLHYFKSVNRKIGSKLTVWYMKKETSEHVHSAIKVFIWIVLPVGLTSAFAVFFFFRENVFGSVLWGQLIFFYSNFLPDLPSIYRTKEDRITEDLAWSKKFALLLFAPLLIWALFSGIRLRWKTAQTFHNLRSLVMYGVFLLLLGFLLYGQFPLSIGNIIDILSFPFHGVIGYLTHLKVDKVW